MPLAIACLFFSPFVVASPDQPQSTRPFFPFLQLPPEIRNKVYRLVLVSAANDILISDMDYRLYHHLDMHTSRQLLRTPYRSYTTEDDGILAGISTDGDSIFDEWTTYNSPVCPFGHCSFVRNTSSLFRVNRQVRSESLPIFYGENTFYFCSEWAVLPFLEDRTPLARTSIRHAKLYLMISADGLHFERQQCWIRNCKYMAQNLPRLESLSLKIVDFEGRLLRADKKYDKWCMRWVLAMMEIKVAKVEVMLEISDAIHYFTSDSSGVWAQIEAAEERLLGVLKRGMLRDGSSEETGTAAIDHDDLLTSGDEEDGDDDSA